MPSSPYYLLSYIYMSDLLAAGQSRRRYVACKRSRRRVCFPRDEPTCSARYRVASRCRSCCCHCWSADMIIRDADVGISAECKPPTPVALYGVVVSGRVDATDLNGIGNVTRLVIVS